MSKTRLLTSFSWTIRLLLCAGMSPVLCAQSVAAVQAATSTAEKSRARQLGIPLDGTPGLNNAITDVAGVEVGHATIIAGAGKLVAGKGPVRTGVTAVLPRGRTAGEPVFAGWFTLNGNGEMTGTTWVEESGVMGGPVMITNTHSVGIVHDAVIEWLVKNGRDFDWSLPVVAETWDGALNDINGFHVRKEHAFAALDSARTGRVTEGNVGGGTGMVCHGFKGGIGTSSRKLTAENGGYTVGVLVQCNYGARRLLRIAGVPVGEEISGLRQCIEGGSQPKPGEQTPPPCDVGSPSSSAAAGPEPYDDVGSIIIVVATDAPLLPHQLKRVAKRASLGIAKMGGLGGNSSGDIFIAFSTANKESVESGSTSTVTMLSNDRINAIFEATVQATEESIINAMLAAETMTGANSLRVSALPHDLLVQVMRKYNRLKNADSK